MRVCTWQVRRDPHPARKCTITEKQTQPRELARAVIPATPDTSPEVSPSPPPQTSASERGVDPATPDVSPSTDPNDATAYPDEPGLLDDIATKLKFRDRIERNPALKHAYKIGVGIVGFVVVVAGIVMIPLPGPGWLVVIAGLAILASEFAWAERLLKFTKRHVIAWTRWVTGQALWLRLLIGLATLAFVYGVVVVTLHVTGVPNWVPHWVPLWH